MTDLRNFDEASQLFLGATEVAFFNKFLLKRKITDISIYYGMYDNENLIGYFWLMKMRDYKNCVKAYEIHVLNSYQNQGIGTFFYRYLLEKEKYTVVNDFMMTKNSDSIWKKIINMSHIIVGTYDARNNEFDFESLLNTGILYNNDYLHYAARLKLLQDINVDQASEVTTNILLSTLEMFSTPINQSGHIKGQAKPLSFEL